MEKKLIIFDQDGTLVDTAPGSVWCFRKTAEDFGRTGITDGEFYSGLCGPFLYNVKRVLDLDDSEVMPAILDYVRTYGEFECYNDYNEYPCMKEVLRELSKSFKLAVATMMYGEYSVKTLTHMGVADLFTTIQGTVLDRFLSKQDVIDECMRIAGCTPEEAIVIGDSPDDLCAARGAGIDFIGVAYGYGFTVEDCRKEGIPYVEKPSDLLLRLR